MKKEPMNNSYLNSLRQSRLIRNANFVTMYESFGIFKKVHYNTYFGLDFSNDQELIEHDQRDNTEPRSIEDVIGLIKIYLREPPRLK